MRLRPRGTRPRVNSMRTCDYCRHDNPDTEHRCRRCGRRLTDDRQHSAPRPVPASRTSPAHQLAIEPRPSQAADAPPPDPEPARRPLQKPLFSNHVVRFEDYSPSSRRRRPRQTARRSAGKRAAPTAQQSFDFDAAAAAAPAIPFDPAASRLGMKRVASAIEPVRDCDLPVASPLVRTVAAAADLGVVAVAMAAFVVIFYYLSGGIPMLPASLAVLAGTLALLTALYKLMWCFADGDSPGVRWCGLRLMHFDGRRPSRHQRIQRLASACLSLSALGLGSLWALGDQEGLTWHDHISRTFPSPRER